MRTVRACSKKRGRRTRSVPKRRVFVVFSSTGETIQVTTGFRPRLARSSKKPSTRPRKRTILRQNCVHVSRRFLAITPPTAGRYCENFSARVRCENIEFVRCGLLMLMRESSCFRRPLDVYSGFTKYRPYSGL